MHLGTETETILSGFPTVKLKYLLQALIIKYHHIESDSEHLI